MALTRSLLPVSSNPNPDFVPKSIKNVCTTGTESAPTTAHEGADLTRVYGFIVVVEADVGQTLSGGGTLSCYTWNEFSGVWDWCGDAVKTVPATAASKRGCSFAGDFVVAPRSRIDFRPNGVTVSSGGCTVYIIATDSSGRAL